MKFKYYYLENKLWKITETNPAILIEKQFTTDYGASGFILEPSNHWITFTIYENKIRVFYKQVANNEITYYQNDFNKSDIIGFEFSPEDQIIKNEKGQWVKKTP